MGWLIILLYALNFFSFFIKYYWRNLKYIFYLRNSIKYLLAWRCIYFWVHAIMTTVWKSSSLSLRRWSIKIFIDIYLVLHLIIVSILLWRIFYWFIWLRSVKCFLYYVSWLRILILTNKGLSVLKVLRTLLIDSRRHWIKQTNIFIGRLTILILLISLIVWSLVIYCSMHLLLILKYRLPFLWCIS